MCRHMVAPQWLLWLAFIILPILHCIYVLFVPIYSDLHMLLKWTNHDYSNLANTIFSLFDLHYNSDLDRFSQPNIGKLVWSNESVPLLSPRDACPVGPNISEPEILVMVPSVIVNYGRRTAIRNSWANTPLVRSGKIKIIFVVGQNFHESSTSQDQRIKIESQSYGDILQENFHDSYYNLTTKTLMLLKWYNQKCSHVPYLLKCDDDVFLNTKKLHNFVSTITVDDVLIGYLFCGIKPVRFKMHKWYVPEFVYSEDTYPPYVAGFGYLMSSSAAQKLFRAARHVPWFLWEDVYLTGMVAQAAGITPEDHNDFYYFHCTQIDACIYSQIILAPNLMINDITRLTRGVENLDEVECRNRGVLQKRPQVHCPKTKVLNWRTGASEKKNVLLMYNG